MSRLARSMRQGQKLESDQYVATAKFRGCGNKIDIMGVSGWTENCQKAVGDEAS
jgi:hypothetical protein